MRLVTYTIHDLWEARVKFSQSNHTNPSHLNSHPLSINYAYDCYKLPSVSNDTASLQVPILALLSYHSLN